MWTTLSGAPNGIFWIYVAAVITGTGRGFSQPSLYALIPQLVAREALSASSAWITSAFQISAVTGPAAAGLLYAEWGPLVPYSLELVLLSVALGSLAMVRHRPKPAGAASSEPIFVKLTSGIRFVFSHELLLSALALDMFAVLFGGVTAILPIFAGEILAVGPRGLGWLRAAPSAGAMLVSLTMIRRPVDRGAGKVLLAVITGFGLCIIGFGFSRSFTLSLFLLALSGAFDSVSMVVRGAIVTLCSPPEMRGRIAAVNSIFIGSSNELGAFESGLAAKFLGTIPSVLFGGSMTLLSVALAAWLSPRLRKMNVSDLVAGKLPN